MRLPDLRRIFRRRNRGPQLQRDEALGARPVRNPAIDWERQENGLVLLTIPVEVKPWMRPVRFLVQVPEQRQVELDEVGSDVWEWCDGSATVAELTSRLAAHQKLNPREAEVSLTQFLQDLAKRRFLGLALDVDPERAAELDQAERGRGAPRG